jgi:two-component system invasion response regulator UvrY
MNILIGDDHQIFREGVKRILAEEPSVLKVGEAAHAQEVLDAVDHHPWDIVILDIRLPGRSGIDILKEIKHRHPTLAVLMLSMYPADQYALRAFRAGASGYLTKSSAAQDLMKALTTIRGGGKYISPDVADALAESIQTKHPETLHKHLSDREFEVFHLIATGKAVGEIAKELNLSVKTISTHRLHILEKLNLRNNSDIVQFALNQQLLP